MQCCCLSTQSLYMSISCVYVSCFSSETSKGDKCAEIKDAFHPNPKTHSVEECQWVHGLQVILISNDQPLC